LTLAYDITGRVTKVTDPLENVASYGYDKMGNLTSITDQNGNTSTFSYDLVGNLKKENLSYGAIRTYEYDSLNRLVKFVNGRGQETGLTYDNSGRLATYDNVSYVYDNNGNVLTVTDQAGTITRTYDALNRITSVTDTNGNTISYQYDEVSNLKAITYPSGEVVTYTYNLLNQLTKVTDYKGRETLYTYDENSRLLTTKTPDGTVETCAYNVAGQLIQKKIAYKDNVVTHKYSYDETYKTISESAEIQNESIFPELNGTGNFNDAVMSYGNGNRLETYNGKTLMYDNDGNMTNAPLNGTMTEYVYDKYNNLISVGTTQYSYDAEGTRISQNNNGDTTTYITNKNTSLSQLLVKQNSDGTETIYVYGLGLISQETKTGATYSNYRAYQFDNRGSALSLTNQSGEITDRFFFDPYGELIGRHGNTDTIFMYVGKYGVQTDNNGLLYMRARYYNTDIKRFVNVDPIRDGLNWYGYVEGDPVNKIDPTGLDSYMFYNPDTFGFTDSYITAWQSDLATEFYGGDTSKVHLIPLTVRDGKTSKQILEEEWSNMSKDSSIDVVLFHGHGDKKIKL